MSSKNIDSLWVKFAEILLSQQVQELKKAKSTISDEELIQSDTNKKDGSTDSSELEDQQKVNDSYIQPRYQIHECRSDGEYPCDEWDFKCSLEKNMNRHSKNKLQCKYCLSILPNTVSLQRHKRSVHIKPFKCKVCDYKAGSGYQLKKHNQYHHENLLFRCDLCGFSNKSELNLGQHIKRNHNSITYKCNECPFKGKNQDRLNYHIDKFHNEKIYECDECKKQVPTKVSLQAHKRRYHSERNKYFCDRCEYASFEERFVKHHVSKIHEGKRFYCDNCEKTFADDSSLRQHIRRDHKKEFLLCTKCEFKTLRNYRLKEHMNMHEGISFNCNTCNYKTHSKPNYKKHRRVNHEKSKQKKYICDQCNYASHCSSTLKRHTLIHGEKLKCDMCPYETAHKLLLKSHKDVEHLGLGYECKICGVRKSRHCYLRDHMKNKHGIS